LVEVITERFRGHSISDPGLYRSKELLKESMTRDPLILMQKALLEEKMIDEESYKEMDKQAREIAVEAMKYADQCPWPDPITLEEDVYAP